MKTLYLHIGTPKTGTTALQKFLWLNREVLLQHGLLFPDFGFRYRGVSRCRNGHFLVTTSYQDENGCRILEKEQEDYRNGLDQLKEAGKTCDRILLTDESIYNASRRSRTDFYETLKADLEEMHMELKVIVYLRRQDLFTQSHWAQKVKVGSCQNFHEYLDSSFMENYPLDYYEYISHLSSCLGRESLIIRPFESGQFRGEKQIIQSDFLSVFGLKLSDGFTLGQRSCNTRLDDDQLEIQQVINRFPSMKRTFKNPKINNVLWDPYFRPAEQKQFMEKYCASNEALAREFLDRDDGQLFYDTIRRPSGYRTGEADLSRDIARVYGRAITELDRENRKLRKELDDITVFLDRVRRHPLYRFVKKCSVYKKN